MANSKKNQAVTGKNIEGEKGISEDGSDKSNGEGDDSVRNREYCSRVEEERNHEEGIDDDIIQSLPVTAAQPVNKHDTAQNWVDKTGPQYRQGIPVLQFTRLVNIPNTTLRRDINFIK